MDQFYHIVRFLFLLLLQIHPNYLHALFLFGVNGKTAGVDLAITLGLPIPAGQPTQEDIHGMLGFNA
jgi:hypothetical protein